MCFEVKPKNCTDSLREKLSHQMLHVPFVQWDRETKSTQDAAKEYVKKSRACVRAVFVADRQSCGRGTRGRQWIAPKSSVLMTVVAPLPLDLRDSSGITVAIGLAAAQALRAFQRAVCVKWPNDLWLFDGKMAGILCETVKDQTGGLHVAAGIGVNIAMDCEDKNNVAATGYRASSLLSAVDFETLSERDVQRFRVNVAAALAQAMLEAIETFSIQSMKKAVLLWPQRDAFARRRVRVTAQGRDDLIGVDCGITERAELILDVDDTRCIVPDGSLRPVDWD